MPEFAKCILSTPQCRILSCWRFIQTLVSGQKLYREMARSAFRGNFRRVRNPVGSVNLHLIIVSGNRLFLTSVLKNGGVQGSDCQRQPG